MSYKLTGTVKQIGSTVQVTEKFKKREIVVTDTSSTYPQHVTFQLTQDKCDMLDAFKEGQEVEVSFNVEGREYADKNTGEIRHFNSLTAWRIEAGLAPMPAAAPVAAVAVAPVAAGDDSDLPF
jgi:hypothetical protein